MRQITEAVLGAVRNYLRRVGILHYKYTPGYGGGIGGCEESFAPGRSSCSALSTILSYVYRAYLAVWATYYGKSGKISLDHSPPIAG